MSSFSSRIFFLAMPLFLSVASLPAVTNTPPLYRVEVIDYIPGLVPYFGYPGVQFSLNNRGQIAAQTTSDISSTSPEQLILARKGKITRSVNTPGYYSTDFNDHGVSVGVILPQYVPTGYARGESINLSNRLGYTQVTHLALNDDGVVVGGAFADDIIPFAFVNDKRGSRELGRLITNGAAWATAVNNRGQIVGAAVFVPHEELPFYNYHAVIFTKTGPQDLGALEGGAASAATAINDAGQIIGYSTSTQTMVRTAFLYRDGSMRALPPLPGHGFSRVFAINKHGAIVGESQDDIHGPRAVIYINGVVWDLNSFIPESAGMILNRAYWINDHGRILVSTTESQVAILTPVQ